MYNILTERLIRVATADGICWATLPEVLALLIADKVEAFPALRPHQRHAWHAFLVQLAAMAMHRAGVTEPPTSAAEWAVLIHGLTPEWQDDEPWQLVVDDITKPAFMQPPARSATVEIEYGTKPAKRGKQTIRVPDEDKIIRSADGLDMLVTSKNHDLKASVVSLADMDDWIFALVTLQTTEGYGGARNYGVSRMPSGYGNRSAFSITPSARPGSHVKRDMTALLDHRQAILNEYKVTENGIGLLWVEPWDGEKSETLTIDRMEPFYIEVCRRVRLREVIGKLEALRANSLDRRIKDAKGMTGDPWAPVGKATNQRDTPPAFLGPRKFGYERIVDGLFSPDWTAPPLLQMSSDDRNSSETVQLVARGMVRGEGGTSGYHERFIPLTPTTARVFGRGDANRKIGEIARERIAQIGKVKDALRHAVATFAAAGEASNIKPEIWARANPWSNKLDEIVDVHFFEHLQTEVEVEGNEDRQRIRNDWLLNGTDGVIDHARNILRRAENSLPCPVVHRYRARVNADGVFDDRMQGANGLPEAFKRTDPDGENPNDDPATSPQNPPETQMTLFT